MDDIRLYLLMRTDVPTMNPGKAVAQGSHAANQCVAEGRAWAAENAVHPDPVVAAKASRLEAMIAAWEDQTGKGFGTCIVLGVTEAQLRVRTKMAQHSGHHAGITHDPTYPMMMPPPRRPWLPHAVGVAGAIVALAAGFAWTALAIASLWTLYWLCGLAAGAAKASQPMVIPLDTCGYVFGPAEEVKPCLIGLELMR